MRIVVALGGNAMLKRGQPLTAENQRENLRTACEALAPLAAGNDLVVSHGNGPQVGLLALQNAAYREVNPYPLDLLGAQTEGMIGYLIQLELGNFLPPERRLVTLLTPVEVDAGDPAFGNPTKPIGPVYTTAEAAALTAESGWAFRPDGEQMRRVVPSPLPRRIFGIEPVKWMLERQCVVICAGGGGIPVMYTDEPVPAGHRLSGVEAVIDKDLASAMLATEIGADVLVMATDVDAVYTGWGTDRPRAVRRAGSEALGGQQFAEGSMGPKVKAACEFVRNTGRVAVIGSSADLTALADGSAGTVIGDDAPGLELADGGRPAESY